MPSLEMRRILYLLRLPLLPEMGQARIFISETYSEVWQRGQPYQYKVFRISDNPISSIRFSEFRTTLYQHKVFRISDNPIST